MANENETEQCIDAPNRRRSSRRKNENVLYDQKYHPADQVLRPKSARTLKHRGDVEPPQKKRKMSKLATLVQAEEESEDNHSQAAASISSDDETTDHDDNSFSTNRSKSNTDNVIDLLAGDFVPMSSSRHGKKPLQARDEEQSGTFKVGLGDLSQRSNSEDQSSLFDFEEYAKLDVFDITSFSQPANLTGSEHISAEGSKAQTTQQPTEASKTQPKDEELHTTLNMIIQHASRALAVLESMDAPPIVVAPNSSGSVSSGKDMSLSSGCSTPPSSRTVAPIAHRCTIDDLPDTGFLGPDGSPGNAMDIFHGLTPPPRPAPISPSAVRGTPPGLRTPHHFSQPISTADRYRRSSRPESYSSSIPPDYYLKPYPSFEAKKQARRDGSQEFMIHEDDPSETIPTPARRHFHDVGKENPPNPARVRRLHSSMARGRDV